MAAEQTKPNKIGGIALHLLFWLPLISGVVSRLVKSSIWFRDYGALACGAEKWLNHEPIYQQQLTCPGIVNLPYVYPPFLAQAYALVIAQFGQQGALYLYAAIFALGALTLIFIILSRKNALPGAKRSWFAAFLTGTAVYMGNIGVVLIAMIGASALFLRKRPSVLVLAIAIAAAVKPVLITFAAIFLLLPMPLMRRAAYFLAAVALGLAPTLALIAEGGPLAQQWIEFVNWSVYTDRQGDGYFGWLALLGAPLTGAAPAMLYVAFAGLMTCAAIAIAETLDLDLEGRILLGLSIGTLILPRLMPYDLWLLGPGFMAAAAAMSGQTQRVFVWGLLAACVLALVGNMADLADFMIRIATFVLALVVLAAAIWRLVQDRARLAQLTRRVWSAPEAV